MPPRLSLIVPAYNEEKRIGVTLINVKSYFLNQPFSTEVIVVDDGSTDATSAIIQHNFPEIKLIRYPHNRGKGFAVKKGMAEAQGDVRVYYDADGSTPIEETEKLWPEFEKGADIVIGSRALPDSVITVRQSRLREDMGRAYNLVLKMLGLTAFSDTQCGFKAFTRIAAETLFPLVQMNRFSFDAELLFLAGKMGFLIREIPVRWINSPESRVRIVADSISMFCGAVTIRWNWMKGAYRPLITRSR